MSKISWTQKTWNPIVGCSKVSAGCDHCYASGDSPHRFASKYERDGVITIRGTAKKPGLTWVPRTPEGKSLGKGAQWTGEIRCLPWQLDVPLRRKKPTTYFVNSLSDMFHESLVDCEEGRRFIAAIFGVMAACPQHIFQVLTKRPHKASAWFEWLDGEATRQGLTGVTAPRLACVNLARTVPSVRGLPDRHREPLRQASMGCWYWWGKVESDVGWPLQNVWIGTSAEDQRAADERLPELLRVPAALRFLSCEPLLGPLDLRGFLADDGFGPPPSPRRWVITGGESGPKARPCEVSWIRSIVDQCKAAGVSVWVKQLGAKPKISALSEWRGPGVVNGIVQLKSRTGSDPAEWPEELRVQEMPCTK